MENQENQDKIKTDDGVNSVIDIRGIQFDISSVLKDVTNSIKNNLKTSFDDVFKNYELYKSTHDALLQIPFIKDLYNKNSELSLQVEMLKQEHYEHEEEPTITLNIHETLSDEKKNNHTEEDDVNKPILTDFLKTNKVNQKQQSETNFEFEIIDNEEEEDEDNEEESQDDEEESQDDEEESQDDEEESQDDEEEEAEEEETEEEETEEEEAEEEEAEEEEAEEEETEEEEAEEEEAEEEEAEEEKAEEEEAEEEEAEEEKAEEEKAEEEKAEEEKAEEEEAEEEEEEVYEIVIKNVTYYTTDEKNGDIYSCVNDDVGEVVGKFKNGKPSFTKRK